MLSHRMRLFPRHQRMINHFVCNYLMGHVKGRELRRGWALLAYTPPRHAVG